MRDKRLPAALVALLAWDLRLCRLVMTSHVNALLRIGRESQSVPLLRAVGARLLSVSAAVAQARRAEGKADMSVWAAVIEGLAERSPDDHTSDDMDGLGTLAEALLTRLEALQPSEADFAQKSADPLRALAAVITAVSTWNASPDWIAGVRTRLTVATMRFSLPAESAPWLTTQTQDCASSLSRALCSLLHANDEVQLVCKQLPTLLSHLRGFMRGGADGREWKKWPDVRFVLAKVITAVSDPRSWEGLLGEVIPQALALLDDFEPSNMVRCRAPPPQTDAVP